MFVPWPILLVTMGGVIALMAWVMFLRRVIRCLKCCYADALFAIGHGLDVYGADRTAVVEHVLRIKRHHDEMMSEVGVSPPTQDDRGWMLLKP